MDEFENTADKIVNESCSDMVEKKWNTQKTVLSAFTAPSFREKETVSKDLNHLQSTTENKKQRFFFRDHSPRKIQQIYREAFKWLYQYHVYEKYN